MYYVVKYKGPFGFIKPWTAVRDDETFSQQFLTPSIIEGIRQKLEVSAIIRHRLNYCGISVQQEATQPKAYSITNKIASRPRSILKRGVIIDPHLYLAFPSFDEADKATREHICLSRNEDILLPEKEILLINDNEFDAIPGFELIFGNAEDSFLVGYNRFSEEEPEPMYGSLRIFGDPIRKEEVEL